MRVLLAFTLVASLAGCSRDWDRFSSNGDGAIADSSGPVDSGTPDATDSGTIDSSAPDSTAPDSTAPDSTAPDSGIVRDGLILHLPFDESGGTMTRDTVSGADVGAVEGGAVFEAGVHGNALRFDGGDDRVVVSLPAPIDVGRRFTISLWMHADALDGVLFACEGLQHIMLRLEPVARQLEGISARYNEKEWGSYFVYDDFAVVSTGEWRHIVMTAHDGDLRLYVDGTEGNMVPVGTPPAEAEVYSSCHVSGSAYGHVDNPFDGAIDDIRLYGRRLGIEEIRTLAGR